MISVAVWSLQCKEQKDKQGDQSGDLSRGEPALSAATVVKSAQVQDVSWR